jgi:hypothetical protein
MLKNNPCYFLFILLWASSAEISAHGIAGDRYFPPTISVDDPYAADEAHTVIGKTPNIGGADTRASNMMMAGFGVEPMDGFGIAIDGLYRDPNTNLNAQSSGFDNLYFTVKKELTINDVHEFAISLGINGQIGGSGGEGSVKYTTYAPSIFYAKGFGDLPSSMRLLRPFAVTGVLGYQIPTDQTQARVLNWGFTIQYSFLYLNDHIQTIGWGDPFKRMIAVVEFPVQTCMTTICNGQMLGSMNPGIVWVGSTLNLSLEAVLPINSQSGRAIGGLFQIHKYLGH